MKYQELIQWLINTTRLRSEELKLPPGQIARVRIPAGTTVQYSDRAYVSTATGQLVRKYPKAHRNKAERKQQKRLHRINRELSLAS